MHDLREGVLAEFFEASQKGIHQAQKGLRDTHLVDHIGDEVRATGRSPRDYAMEYRRRRTRARAYQREYERKKRWERGINVVYRTGLPNRKSHWFFVIGTYLDVHLGIWMTRGDGVQNVNRIPWNETRPKRRAV